MSFKKKKNIYRVIFEVHNDRIINSKINKQNNNKLTFIFQIMIFRALGECLPQEKDKN